MSDETNLTEERKWLNQDRAKIAVHFLQKRHLEAQYVSTRQDALSTVLRMIPEEAIVSRGDSVTLDQIGIVPELRKRHQRVIYPVERNEEGFWIYQKEEKRKLERETFFSDIFLTSVEGVTLDGKLVSTDGHGSRVSPMIIGPAKVIVVAGVNKIVKDVNEALARISSISAPMNNKRHCSKHHLPELMDLPCVKTGKCADCYHELRTCNYRVIIEGILPEDRGRINVILIGEELGI